MSYQKRKMMKNAQGRPRAVYQSMGMGDAACEQTCTDAYGSGGTTPDQTSYAQCMSACAGGSAGFNATTGSGSGSGSSGSSSSSSSGSSSGGFAQTIGQIGGSLFGALLGPKPAAPAQTGPSPTTVILLAGGAGLALYLLLRNK